MPALMSRATPVSADNSALLHVLEAYIETLKAENESLKPPARSRQGAGGAAHGAGSRTRAVPVVVSPSWLA